MTPSGIFGVWTDSTTLARDNSAGHEESSSESALSPVITKTSNRGRHSNLQRLLSNKSDSGQSILNFLETKRKRDPEELNKDTESPGTKKTNLLFVTPALPGTDNFCDADMEKILQ